MSVKLTDLQCKEVICVANGQRLGFVSDLLLELPEGKACALVVPGPCRLMGFGGHREDYVIPWGAIQRIGPDIILVDTRPDDCRVARQKQWKGK